MKIVDFGSYIVVYNFIVGVVVALSSEKLGAYAGCLGGPECCSGESGDPRDVLAVAGQLPCFPRLSI